jgi:hypothetical protein
MEEGRFIRCSRYPSFFCVPTETGPPGDQWAIFENPPLFGHVETSGAPLAPEVARLARETLNATPINQYGIREVWAIGYARDGAPFEILDDVVIAELIDESGGVIRGVDTEGAVVVTSKIMKLLPVVRYVTGDRGRWVDAPDGRRLELVGDRAATLIRVRDRWVSGTRLFKTALIAVYDRIGYGRIDYIQIRKTAEKTLTVDLAGLDSDAVFVALGEHVRGFDPDVRLVQNRIADPAAILRDPDRKPYLFINQYDKIDRSLGGKK